MGLLSKKTEKILNGGGLSTECKRLVDKVVYLWITSLDIVAPEAQKRNSDAGFVKLMSVLGLVYNLCKSGLVRVDK